MSARDAAFSPLSSYRCSSTWSSTSRTCPRSATGPRRLGIAGLAYGCDPPAQHDLIAIAGHLHLGRVAIAGHSMGAFVAAVAALRHPDRISSLLLVDGGVTLPTPGGGDIDATLEAVIGPAMRRLRMTFGDAQAYLDFWRAHPALSADWSPVMEAYALRDLVGQPPTLRSSCNLDAVRQDATDTLLDDQSTTAIHRVGCPTTLLWCERGILDEPQGLYDEARFEAAGVDRTRIGIEQLADVNHYTILLSANGSAAVASHIGWLP